MANESNAAFFSYSRKDSKFARKLAEDLKAGGAVVWIDQLDIDAGQQWDTAIEGALMQCQRLLLILTPDSVQSGNVRDEIAFAIDEGKLILPVLYQDCSVPLRLRRVQHIDFRTDYELGLKALLKALNVGKMPDLAGSASSGEPSQSAAVVSNSDSGKSAVHDPPRELTPTRPLKKAKVKPEGNRKTQSLPKLKVENQGSSPVSSLPGLRLKRWVGQGDLSTLKGQSNYVAQVALSANGRTAISLAGYPSSSIKVWDLTTGEPGMTPGALQPGRWNCAEFGRQTSGFH